MFTGLVEEMGIVEAVREVPDGRRLEVSARAALEGLKHGDSLAISGVCQTVVELLSAESGPAGAHLRAAVVAVGETLRRTTFGDLRSGSRVNLERPLRVGDRLGGHLVSGHVDGVGRIVEIRPDPADWGVRIAVPNQLAPFFIEKGSVCVDGVSLTVGTLDDEATETRFWVYIIPETRERTLFGYYRVGDRVNIETDLLGKYVLRSREVAARVGSATRGDA